MHTLSIDEIETLASHHGVCKSEVERFLDTVGRAGTLESELLDMYYDARLYSWNISTVRAIERGIRLAHENEAVSPYLIRANGEARRKAGIET